MPTDMRDSLMIKIKGLMLKMDGGVTNAKCFGRRTFLMKCEMSELNQWMTNRKKGRRKIYTDVTKEKCEKWKSTQKKEKKWKKIIYFLSPCF
jgi:hypothetical protein